MRRRRGSEIAVGILALATAVLVLWGYFWLTGQPLGHQGYPVLVRLHDAAGLERGDRVRLAGVEVGNVRRVRLDAGSILAELRVDADVRLPSDSRAVLRSGGVFGDRHIELVPGRAATLLRGGDTLSGANMRTLSETIETVGARADEFLARASAVLSPPSVEALQNGALSLARALDELAVLNASLRKTAEGLGRGLNEGRVDRTAAGFEATARDLAAASADLRASTTSLASILGKIDRGHGSLGRAVNDPALYDALLQAAESFNAVAQRASSLVQDVRTHPDRYVKVSVF